VKSEILNNSAWRSINNNRRRISAASQKHEMTENGDGGEKKKNVVSAWHRASVQAAAISATEK